METVAKAKPSTSSQVKPALDRNKTEKMNPEKQLREIRNLLFAETVARLDQQIDGNHAESDRQFTEIEARLKSTMDIINKKIDEQVERLDKAILAEHSEMLSTSADISKELAAVNQALQETRAWAEKEFINVRSELSDKHDALSKRITTVKNDLMDKKVDRTAFASMLAGMASNLDHESVDGH